MRPIKKIIVHCTDSEFGDVEFIDRIHREERGFTSIGYHYLITNCYPSSHSLKNRIPMTENDGAVHIGRPENEQGAHCQGQNEDSLGVALIGKEVFSSAQIYAMFLLVRRLMEKYGLNRENVFCHNYFNPEKTCPNLDINFIRDHLY